MSIPCLPLAKRPVPVRSPLGHLLLFLVGGFLALGVLLQGHGVVVAAEEATAATHLFQDASRLQNSGKFADALVKWRQFVATYKDDQAIGQAYQGLGTCLLETGDFAAAVDAFNQALAKLPEGESGVAIRWNRAIASYRSAEQSRKVDDYEKAAKVLQQVADDKGMSPARRDLATFYLARTEQARGLTDAARVRYGRLQKPTTDPSVAPHALLALASLAEQARDGAEAIRLYQSFLHDYPEHAAVDEARLGLGDAFLQEGRREAAEELFGQLQKREHSPAAPYALYRWGELAYLRGDYGAASERLSRFLRQVPKSPYRDSALLLAGESHLQQTEFPQAVKVFEQFLKEYPDHGKRLHAQVGLAQALFESKDYARAEARLKETLDRLKDAKLRGQALVLLARCASRLDHSAEALDRYAECFQGKVQLEEPERLRNEAVTLALTAGKTDLGLRWTDALVEQFPKSLWTGQTQLLAARRLADQRDYEQALKRSRWVIDAKLPEAQPEALYLAGFCSMKLRKFRDAADLYQTLLGSYPKFEQAPAVLFSLAVAQEALGARSKALNAYQQLLRRFADHPLAEKARERVQRLQMKP